MRSAASSSAIGPVVQPEGGYPARRQVFTVEQFHAGQDHGRIAPADSGNGIAARAQVEEAHYRTSHHYVSSILLMPTSPNQRSIA